MIPILVWFAQNSEAIGCIHFLLCNSYKVPCSCLRWRDGMLGISLSMQKKHVLTKTTTKNMAQPEFIVRV